MTRPDAGWPIVAAILVCLASFVAHAESGYQVIDGTRVFTVIDRARGVATFSNDCGSQTLTQGQLQAGAKPTRIIPCPRPSQPQRSTSGSSTSSQYRRNCEFGREHLSDAKREKDALVKSVMINLAIGIIRKQCPLAGMSSVVTWAESELKAMNADARDAAAKAAQQKRLDEKRSSADPKLQFDARVLSTEAETAYHAGQYDKAIAQFEKAIGIYTQLGEPLARDAVVVMRDRAQCKSAIRRAHQAATPDAARQLWTQAEATACQKFAEDRKYVRTQLAKLKAAGATSAPRKSRGKSDAQCVGAAPTALDVKVSRNGSQYWVEMSNTSDCAVCFKITDCELTANSARLPLDCKQVPKRLPGKHSESNYYNKKPNVVAPHFCK